MITKEETGLVRLNIMPQVTHRAKIHIQVGQPPNLLLSMLQKLPYKIPFHPRLWPS